MPAEFIAKGAARDRLIKEADFAFRQAFAVCPGSPEVVFRYTNFLVGQKRQADALAVAQTALDAHQGMPDENTFRDLVNSIKAMQPAEK